MSTFLFFFLILCSLITEVAVAQTRKSISEYEAEYEKKGKTFFEAGKYDLARDQYASALALKENCVRCSTKIAECDAKIKAQNKTSVQKPLIITPKKEPIVLNGVFKKTFPDGVYEGNFVNGVRAGKGKYTFTNGDKFDGEWKDDVRLQGTYTFVNGNNYTGYFKNETRNGWGEFKWHTGTSYKGEYKNGKMEGVGIFKGIGIEYMGEFSQGLFNGFGIYTCDSGYQVDNCPGARAFYGSWKNGLKDNGRCYDKLGRLIYVGSFENDKPSSYPNVISNEKNYKNIQYNIDTHYDGYTLKEMSDGLGKFIRKTSSDSIVYTGEFKINLFEGYGMYSCEKYSYIGEWHFGIRKGIGIEQEKTGQKFTYISQWYLDKKNGLGVQFTYNFLWDNNQEEIPFCKKCTKYVGQWQNDKKNGWGRCYDKDNKLIFEGTFVDDKPVNYPY